MSLRGLYPSVRLIKHVCEIGRYGVVVLDHLLYRKDVLGWLLFPCALCCSGESQPEGQEKGEGYEPAMRSCKRLFFSSPLTGAWKNVLRTECMRFASPGARVGHA